MLRRICGIRLIFVFFIYWRILVGIYLCWTARFSFTAVIFIYLINSFCNIKNRICITIFAKFLSPDGAIVSLSVITYSGWAALWQEISNFTACKLFGGFAAIFIFCVCEVIAIFDWAKIVSTYTAYISTWASSSNSSYVITVWNWCSTTTTHTTYRSYWAGSGNSSCVITVCDCATIIISTYTAYISRWLNSGKIPCIITVCDCASIVSAHTAHMIIPFEIGINDSNIFYVAIGFWTSK